MFFLLCFPPSFFFFFFFSFLLDLEHTVTHSMTSADRRNSLSFEHNPFLDQTLLNNIKARFPNVPFDKIKVPGETIRRFRRQSLNYTMFSTESDPLEVAPLLDPQTAVDVALQSVFLWIPLADSVREKFPEVRNYSHLPQFRRRDGGNNECILCPLVTRLTSVPPPRTAKP